MNYLTVGTKEIRRDKFRKIEDTDLSGSMKPRGGMWFTEYDKNIKSYNVWVDFILERPNILFYKNRGKNPFVQPCSIITLNADVNLYALHNGATLDYLLKCFPYKDKFSYEDMSKYYDGIYVNMSSLNFCNYDEKVIKKFSSFDINSLILFNLDCINYYQSGEINIEPFDYEGDPYCDKYYEIKIDSEKKRVLKK